jgi:hypothetical protein
MAAASDDALFVACRENDIATLKRLLPRTSIKDLNRLDPDGRTCLHIASSRGNRDIINLLLEHGAFRQTKDRDGRTCVDAAVAQNEEVAEAFARQPEAVAERYTVDEDTDEPINWLFGQDKAEAFSRAIHRGCIKDRGVEKTVKKIEDAKFIPTNDESKEGKLLRYFLNEAREKNDPTYLLRIYTIDGIFYRAINGYMASGKSKKVFKKLCHKWSGYYAGCIMKNPAFKPYQYEGVTYRGMVIDREAFNRYVPGVVVTNKAFQSSSKVMAVARAFSQQRERRLGKVSVLIQYTIVDRKSAIDIRSFSEFPEEEEVLMVPGILFKVDYVNRTVEPYPVHLRQLAWIHE